MQTRIGQRRRGSHDMAEYQLNIIKLVGWFVGCGLTSHSAIFQLHSDGTDVQISKFSPAAGHPTPWAARGL